MSEPAHNSLARPHRRLLLVLCAAINRVYIVAVQLPPVLLVTASTDVIAGPESWRLKVVIPDHV